MKQLCAPCEITLTDARMQPSYWFAHVNLGGWLWSNDAEEYEAFQSLWFGGIVNFQRVGKTVVIPADLKYLS